MFQLNWALALGEALLWSTMKTVTPAAIRTTPPAAHPMIRAMLGPLASVRMDSSISMKGDWM